MVGSTVGGQGLAVTDSWWAVGLGRNGLGQSRQARSRRAGGFAPPLLQVHACPRLFNVQWWFPQDLLVGTLEVGAERPHG